MPQAIQLPLRLSTRQMAEPNGANDTDSHSHRPDSDVIHHGAPQDSTTDNGISRRPRDARIIHLILASLGVHAYHERVPLQIMDFAYRYTIGVLQDALLYADAGHGATGTSGPNNPPSTITAEDLRMSIASRVNHQFNTTLPREFLLQIAHERNKVALPPVDKGYGIRLPPEKYCLTGVNWDLVEGDDLLLDDESDDEVMEGLESGEVIGAVLPGRMEDGAEEMNVDDLFAGDAEIKTEIENDMTDV